MRKFTNKLMKWAPLSLLMILNFISPVSSQQSEIPQLTQTSNLRLVQPLELAK